MKTIYKRLISVILALTVTGMCSFATEATYEKEETVYIIGSPVGEKEQQLVSVWLHANDGTIDMEDPTTLTDVQNIKGNEEVILKEGALHWKSEGSDIYYRGHSEKALPFSVEVTYTLDGKVVAPESLAGQSGEVMITLHFENHQQKSVKVDEKAYTIYAPIAIAGTMHLPVDRFTNVTINHGKLVNDARNQLISFVSLPGLAESFQFESEELADKLSAVSEDIVISATVNDFEMDAMMLIATSEIPELEDVDDASEWMDKIESLKDSGVQMSSATKKLSDGQRDFSVKLGQYANAVTQFNVGAVNLTAAAKTVTDKSALLMSSAEKLNMVSGQFVAGIAKYAEGTTQYTAGAKQFAGAASQFSVGASKVAEATSGLVDKTKILANGADRVNQSVVQLKEGMAQANHGLHTMTGQLGKQKDNNRTALVQQIQAYQAMQQETTAAIQALQTLQLDPAQQQVVTALIQKMTRQQAALEQMTVQSNAALNSLNGDSSVEQLVQVYQQVEKGLVELAKGTGQLAEGTKRLAVGTSGLQDAKNSLSRGASQLSQGAQKLSESIDQLQEGAEKIKQGTAPYVHSMSEFTQGVTAFHDQGTVPFLAAMRTYSEKMNVLAGKNGDLLAVEQKLVNGNRALHEKVSGALTEDQSDESAAFTSDLLRASTIKDELISYAEEMNYFAGDNEQATQHVRYVYKIRGIKK